MIILGHRTAIVRAQSESKGATYDFHLVCGYPTISERRRKPVQEIVRHDARGITDSRMVYACR